MNKEVRALENVLKDFINGKLKFDEVVYEEEALKQDYEFVSSKEKRDAVRYGLTVEDAFRFFIDYSIKKNNSKSTVRTKEKRIRAFIRFLKDPTSFGFTYELDYAKKFYRVDETIINDFLSTRKCNSTKNHNSSYQVLRALFNYLEEDKLITNNPIKKISKSKFYKIKPEIVTLSKVQLKDFIKLFNLSLKTDVRNAMIVSIIIDTGMLPGEIVKLKVIDISASKKEVKVNGELPRHLSISNSTVQLIEKYKKMNNIEKGYLLRSKRDVGQPMESRSISRMIDSRQRWVDFYVTSTILRDTYAYNYMLNNNDLIGLSYELGMTVENARYRYSKFRNIENTHLGDLIWNES